MPMQPKGPGSSIRGAFSPTRAKARKSPPSVMTTELLPMACCKRRQHLVRMQLAVGAFGRVRHALLQFLRALLVSATQLRGPLPVHLGLAISGMFDHRAQGSRRERRVFPRRRGGCPASPTAYRRCGRILRPEIPHGDPYASWKSRRRPTVRTTSASLITAPRMAPTTEGWLSGTRPRLSPVSR